MGCTLSTGIYSNTKGYSQRVGRVLEDGRGGFFDFLGLDLAITERPTDSRAEICENGALPDVC